MLAKDRSFRLRLTRRTRKWDSMKLSFERGRKRERESIVAHGELQFSKANFIGTKGRRIGWIIRRSN